MKKPILFIVVSLLLACSSTAPPKENLLTEVFDTPAYLDALIVDGSIYSVIKTTNYNSNKKTEEISDYDISADLEIIKKVNINNPNWLHKYSLDSNFVSGQLIKTYRALDNELKIHQLSTTHDSAGNILGFEGFMNRDALISSSQRHIKFSSGEGYSIVDKSTSLLGTTKDFGIGVVFKPN